MRAWSVLLHQLRFPLLGLLVVAAVFLPRRRALRLGDIVPADVRLLEVSGLECGESVLTGESLTVDKSRGAVVPGTPLAELAGFAPPAPPTSEAQMD